jgi:hypothetical protein
MPLFISIQLVNFGLTLGSFIMLTRLAKAWALQQAVAQCLGDMPSKCQPNWPSAAKVMAVGVQGVPDKKSTPFARP